MRARAAAIALVAVALLGAPAAAHEVLHSIERGRAIAVKAYFADGEALAYTEYQLFSPADANIPYQKGRTDRSGYVAFMPDAPGPWRLKIADATGHGLDLAIPVEAAGPPAAVPGSPGLVAWAFVLRPVVGVVTIVALFLTLAWLYRRKLVRK